MNGATATPDAADGYPGLQIKLLARLGDGKDVDATITLGQPSYSSEKRSYICVWRCQALGIVDAAVGGTPIACIEAALFKARVICAERFSDVQFFGESGELVVFRYPPLRFE